MEVPAPASITTTASPSKLMVLVKKAIVLVLIAFVLGEIQGWAAPRFYRADRLAGFHTGVLHGMVMPAALPGLLMGQDLPIYAPNNTGRSYNIGYILGINACGTLFFGAAFWRSRKAAHEKPSAR